MKLVKRVLNFYSEHLLIVLFIIVISLLMLVLQGYFSDIDKDFGLSLIPNVIADMVGILVTSYIISVLIQKSEEKKAKERAYKILGNKLSVLSDVLAQNYLNFVSKNPNVDTQDSTDISKGMLNKLKIILRDIDDYIKEDFVSTGVKVLTIDRRTRSVTDIASMFGEQTWSYQQFNAHFKKVFKSNLDDFISRYISELPNDLRESLFKIDDLLLSDILVTPLDHGIQKDISNAQINVENFREIFYDLGQEILELITYFDEYKEDK